MKFLTLAAEMVKGYATSLSMFTKYNVDSVISIMIVRENTNQMISLLPCLTVSLPGGKIGPNLIGDNDLDGPLIKKITHRWTFKR